MKIISHRGNLTGKNLEKENNPIYIEEAIKEGFDVEIDVWYKDKNFWLGHDIPQYIVNLNWLKSFPLWCHAKNPDALKYMLKENLHCFWHQDDLYTLTSKKVPWCYPHNWIDGGITVILETDISKIVLPKKILGICVDNPISWRKR